MPVRATQYLRRPGKLVDARVLTLKAPEIENFALYNDHDDLTEDLLNDKSYSFMVGGTRFADERSGQFGHDQ